MNAEQFKEKLREMGVDLTLTSNKVILLCPFSDHAGLQEGRRANFIIGENTGFGECVICGKKAGFEEVIGAWKEKKNSSPDTATHQNNEHQRNSSDQAKFEILPWGDFSKLPFPENAWRVKNLIPLNGVTMVAAPSGEKKSWMVMELARAVATGQPYLGNPEFSIQQCNVLYIENESSKVGVRDRGKKLGFEDVSAGLFILKQECPPFNTDTAADKLLLVAKENNIGLVIIDTLRSIAGGLREEKAEEVRAFLNRFKKFAAHDITIIITDHCRKPQPFESKTIPRKDQILGSQDKVAAVEAVIMIRSEARSEEIFVHPMKLKSGIERAPFKVLMKEEGTGQISITYAGEFEERAIKIEEAKDLIKGFLKEVSEPQNTSQVIQALLGKAGKTNIENALKEMRENAEIGAEKIGNKFLYHFPTSVDESENQLPPLENAS